MHPVAVKPPFDPLRRWIKARDATCPHCGQKELWIEPGLPEPVTHLCRACSHVYAITPIDPEAYHLYTADALKSQP